MSNKYITQDGMYEIQMVQESVHIRLNNSSRGSECDSAIILLAPGCDAELSVSPEEKI